MLKKVEALDYDANCAYAPPVVDAIVNTDDIQSVKPTSARGVGPFVLVKFRDGSTLTCVGRVDDFL